MKFEIITPQGIILDTEADEVEIPAKLGYVGILEGHTPFFAMLGMGELWYRTGDLKKSLFVQGGYFDVQPHSVSVLSEEALDPEEVDYEEISEKKKEQEELIEKGLKGEISAEEFHKALFLNKKYELLLSLKPE